MASGPAIVEDEVRELVRRRGIDPLAEAGAVRRLVDEVIGDYLDRAVMSSMPPLGDTTAVARTVVDSVSGFGPLQPFLDDAVVEEIWINEPGRVFVARRGRSELTTLILTADQVAELVERMLRTSGRRIDLSTPFVDAMLPDGSRLHVVIPQITRQHMAVNTASRARSARRSPNRAYPGLSAIAHRDVVMRGQRRHPGAPDRRPARVASAGGVPFGDRPPSSQASLGGVPGRALA